MLVDPKSVFQGKVLIIAPHMDDEVLACGGTIARLEDKEKIYAVYATDGMKSPSPIVPWRDSISGDLGEVRVEESRAAMATLGVPEENLHFFRLPEARLRDNKTTLKNQLLPLIGRIEPDQILLPFRYDRHPDHLAVNQIIMEAHEQGLLPAANIYEYFVYYRWRLLPDRDVRQYIKPMLLLEVEIGEKANLKKDALNCFRTQTTIYYPWQTRPILTPVLIEDVSHTPELFLRHDPRISGSSVFSKATMWIKIVHRLEPFLQRWKYRLGALLVRGLKTNGRQPA